jgi:hypothetical protein
MDLSNLLSVVSSIPVDWLVIGVFFVLVAADALRAGSTRAAALSISLPITLFLFQMIPQTVLLGSLSGQFHSSLEQAIIFFVLEAVLFVCLNHMLFSFDQYTSLLSSFVAAFVATVVVLVVWTQVPALQSLWHFDPQVQAIFGDPYRFLWLIFSYLALAFAGS